jgi:HK97 family phage major capsid protein/HK97 family phage prohead protease
MLLKQGFKANFVSDIKSLSLEEDESIIIEGYANTISKDRAGDVIPASTWRKAGALQNYKNNPIILAFHKHDNPIGKAIELEATDLGLRIKARISKAAGKVYDLIKEGVLSTFSVGFMIKDASYDPSTETYFINDVELTEVSVVSVPCNQDSTFILSKSLEDAESFKQQFITPNEAPASPEPTGLKKMDFKLEDLLGQVSQTVKDTMSAQVAAEKAAADAAAKSAAEKAAADAAAKSAARDAAASLVAELENKLKEKDSVFAEAVKAHSADLAAMKEEIAQVVASRSAPVTLSPVAAGVRNKGALKREEAEVDAVVMLSIIKGVPADQMFKTEFGARHFAEKQNTSSSIQVSSNAYETVFSTNLMRDIQAQLVIAPLFEEITMTSANLTIPVNPASGTASWVDSTTYGNTTTSGNTITAALTERTLKTFKLAAKTFLTEETQEDAIIAVLPILRAHLVESHAKAIDLAFLRGTGTNQPKGLINQAAAIGATATEVTTATGSGTVKVTAKMISNARRKLGLYGINLSDITLIVSRDAYWDLLQDDQWADVQQVSTDAVKLRGEVGNIYGMRVLVSDGFEAKAVNKAFAVIVYTKNFVVPRQRDVIVKTDFDVERDRRVFVATQRLNLEALIEVSAGNGAGVVQITYAAT